MAKVKFKNTFATYQNYKKENEMLYSITDFKENIVIDFDSETLGKNLSLKQVENRVEKLVDHLKIFCPNESFILYENVGGQYFRIKTF